MTATVIWQYTFQERCGKFGEDSQMRHQKDERTGKCKENFKKLMKLFSLWNSTALITVYKYLHREQKFDNKDLFHLAGKRRKRSWKLKLDSLRAKLSHIFLIAIHNRTNIHHRHVLNQNWMFFCLKRYSLIQPMSLYWYFVLYGSLEQISTLFPSRFKIDEFLSSDQKPHIFQCLNRGLSNSWDFLVATCLVSYLLQRQH